MNNSFSLEQIVKTCDLNADLIMRHCELDKMAKSIEIKSINPELKQSELAKKLAISTSTLQRYRRVINMHSPYGILQSSNTHTKKQKASNHTELTSNDLKMSSNDLKVTSKDLKMTSNEPVKKSRNKLKGGDPSEIHISKKDFIEQAFSSN